MTRAKYQAPLHAAWRGALAALFVIQAALAQTPPAPTHRESGALIYEGIPPTDPALTARLQPYLHSRGAAFLDWMADGSLLVKTRFGETEQLHRVAGAGGAREQLTFYRDPIEWARGAKQGNGLIFWKDQSGGDDFQIFYLPRARCASHQRRLLRQPGVGPRWQASPSTATTATRSLRRLRGGRDLERGAAAAGRRQAGHLVPARLVGR
jgi:hypothetical protein